MSWSPRTVLGHCERLTDNISSCLYASGVFGGCYVAAQSPVERFHLLYGPSPPIRSSFVRPLRRLSCHLVDRWFYLLRKENSFVCCRLSLPLPLLASPALRWSAGRDVLPESRGRTYRYDRKELQCMIDILQSKARKKCIIIEWYRTVP